MQTETKTCQNCKKEFVIEDEDFNFYKKIDVPPPTFCPACRFQRRLMFRNERMLYKRLCDLCGKANLSMFSPDKPFVVYCSPCWWSDKWDPLSYQKEYDPHRSFFEQLRELQLKIPFMGLATEYTTLVNSDYINEAGHSRNCYLIFNADYCEDCFYGTSLTNVKNVMDAQLVGESELCYEVVNCSKCFNCIFSEDLTDCHDVYFSKNCVGCSNCFGCINLRNKQYYIWNKPYTKEGYQEELKKLKEGVGNFSELQKLREETEQFWQKAPQKYYHGLQNVNVTGDYVYHSKNAQEVYQGLGVEDSKYIQFAKDAFTKDSYDYTIWGEKVERIYDSLCCGREVSDIRFCVTCFAGSLNAEYSMYCSGSSDIFGCFSLRDKKYCILNKQYSKEEYGRLRRQIIEDMQKQPYHDEKGRVWRYGEFFPYSFSFFAYNETMAAEYFSESEERVKDFGWTWRRLTPTAYQITVRGAELPKTSSEITDTFLQTIIECSECGRAYRFIKGELDLLRRLSLPLPQRCFECRHRRRFSRFNPPKLWDRTCGKCNKAIKTSYAPDRKEIIYCEPCYQQEVV